MKKSSKMRICQCGVGAVRTLWKSSISERPCRITFLRYQFRTFKQFFSLSEQGEGLKLKCGDRLGNLIKNCLRITPSERIKPSEVKEFHWDIDFLEEEEINPKKFMLKCKKKIELEKQKVCE